MIFKQELYDELREEFSPGGKMNDMIQNSSDQASFKIQNFGNRRFQVVTVFGGEHAKDHIIDYCVTAGGVDTDEIYDVICACGYDVVVRFGNVVFIDHKKEKSSAIQYLDSLGNEFFVGEMLFGELFFDDEFSLEIFSKGNVVTVVQYNDGIMHLKKDYVMKKAVDLDELVTILKSVVKVKYTKTGNSYTLTKNNQ